MKARRGALLAVLGAALLLRVLAIDHSLPYKFVADTHVVRGALGMASTRDLAPPAGTFTSYPYLLPYLLLPEYAALYAAGRALGTYASAEDFGAKITDDPTPVCLIARGLVVLFGILGVLLAYRVGRRVLGRAEGLLAAYLVATSFLLVHLGKSERPWVPLVTLVLFTAERALAYARRPRLRRALLMGAAAGLAMACHQSGALAVLLPAAAVLARLRGGVARAARNAVLSAAAFALCALVIGFPCLLRGKSAQVGVQTEQEVEGKFDLGGQSFGLESFGVTNVAEVALGFAAAEPALIVLCIAGLFFCARALRGRGALLVLAVYPLVVVVLFLFYEGTHVRYLSTAVPFLALSGGAGAARLLRRGSMARGVALLLLLLPLVQAARLCWVMRGEDTRVEMLAEVAARVEPGACIAVEAYGPPLRFSADALALLKERGKWTARLEEREAAGLTPRDPRRPAYAVVPLERFYEFASVWPHQWLDEPDRDKPVEEFLDEVGARYLVTVDRRPGAPRNSALDDLLARRGRLLVAVRPCGASNPGEANLPMDPSLPLLAIWRVSRPGPLLALWRIE